jgi:hypothetical protein
MFQGIGGQSIFRGHRDGKELDNPLGTEIGHLSFKGPLKAKELPGPSSNAIAERQKAKAKMKTTMALFLVFIFWAGSAFGRDIRTIHVFVALCDNQFQGIIPVPAKIGNGDDPKSNLYWGARYGTKTYLEGSPNWKLRGSQAIDSVVLERCLFQSRDGRAYLIADAYRGRNIREAIEDFFSSVSGGRPSASMSFADVRLPMFSDADLIVYLGHDGLMDFGLRDSPESKDGRSRDVAVLACLSKRFFGPHLKLSKVNPVLLTTHLMAPEAYVLEALAGKWIEGGTKDQIRESAASAYSKYQKCSKKAALALFTHSLE